MSSTAIVVGGGVIGLSTAYHLSRKRFGRIILIEKGPVGDGSSSRAAGIANTLLWTETGIRARKRSLRLFRELSQELEGYTFQDVGCLTLFDPKSWSNQSKLLPLYERLDATFEVLDPIEIGRRWPAFYPREDFIGLYDPLGGYSEPDEYVPALARRIRALGVEVREHQKVIDFIIRSGRMVGVKTPEGNIETDAVICTVHAWTLKVVEQLGLHIPFKNFVHQRYVTRPQASPVRIPATNAQPLNGYVRPASGNRLLVGIETDEREEYRVETTDFHMSELSAPIALKDITKRNFTPFIPSLADSDWECEKIGLIAFSMDGEPILGPVKQLPGFYVAAAFHSGGFAYNPIAGLLLAEFVADGSTSMDVSAFSPDRFDHCDADKYLSSTIQQRDALPRRH